LTDYNLDVIRDQIAAVMDNDGIDDCDRVAYLSTIIAHCDGLISVIDRKTAREYKFDDESMADFRLTVAVEKKRLGNVMISGG